MIRSVFLDRDGILNVYLPGAYVRCTEEMALIPGAAAAIRALNDASIPVIVISNQQGVGKGLMTMDDLLCVQRAIEEELSCEAGARIDAWYYCTDLSSVASSRRKPMPGMLLEAAADHGLDLATTVFIGDSATDIAAGVAADVRATLLVLSGATREVHLETFTPKPDHVFKTLDDAVAWVLKEDLR